MADVVQPGEYYRVNCPYCSDTKFRLYINHRWGIRDQVSGSRNHWLANCFNDNCLADFENRSDLRDSIDEITFGGVCHYTGATQLPALEDTDPKSTCTVNLPDDFRSLDKLPPKHPAIRYLASRSFDPAKIGKEYAIGFSQRACDWSESGRIVIPLYYPDGTLAGWQGRAIKKREEPKYYTAPGTKKSHVLFGLDHLRPKGPVLICEGPTDVWTAHRYAVALLGKSASRRQVALMIEHLSGRPLVVMLDSDARDDAERLAEMLRKGRMNVDDQALVVVARLPRDCDPADLPLAQIKEIAVKAIKRK